MGGFLKWDRLSESASQPIKLHSYTTTMAMMHNPSHPGRILAYYVAGHTVKDVAAHLGVTSTALSCILNGHAPISAEMALRLGKTFNTDPQMWLGVQMQRDLWEASRKKISAKPIAKSAA
ncbi:MAG TPA: HigA family addiction module antitoxin [Acidobacteriaceae bacterium]